MITKTSKKKKKLSESHSGRDSLGTSLTLDADQSSSKIVVVLAILDESCRTLIACLAFCNERVMREGAFS